MGTGKSRRSISVTSAPARRAPSAATRTRRLLRDALRALPAKASIFGTVVVMLVILLSAVIDRASHPCCAWQHTADASCRWTRRRNVCASFAGPAGSFEVDQRMLEKRRWTLAKVFTLP